MKLKEIEVITKTEVNDWSFFIGVKKCICNRNVVVNYLINNTKTHERGRDRYKPFYPICISNLYTGLILDYSGIQPGEWGCGGGEGPGGFSRAFSLFDAY
jgi:hypothetical protein